MKVLPFRAEHSRGVGVPRPYPEALEGYGRVALFRPSPRSFLAPGFTVRSLTRASVPPP